MSDEREKERASDLVSKSIFEIGGVDQIEKVRSKIEEELKEKKEEEHVYNHWASFLKDLQIRIGTLLKADNVSFLMRPCASKSSGGVLLGAVPMEIENSLLYKGTTDGKVAEWLELFYTAVTSLVKKDTVPQNTDEILERLKNTSRSPTNCW